MKKKISIMTWNTGLYSQGNELYSEEKKKKITQPISEEIFDKIITEIINFLEKDNSIAFLQEIPCKANVEYKKGIFQHEKWGKHCLLNAMEERLKEHNIEMKYNLVKKGGVKGEFDYTYQIMMTIAVAKKGTMSQTVERVCFDDKPINREVGVIFNGLNILGIHARWNKDDPDVNRKYLESMSGQADIILGDFNAGNYAGSVNRQVFNNILKEYVCICNMPTRVSGKGMRTCIDHVFVRDNIVCRCSNLVVHEEITYSDHFPITFEVEFV